MNHYFIPKESAPEDERTLHFSFKGCDLVFKTNAGLFSYKEIDYASRLLMENITCEKENATLLDMGCGYGAIGITLAKVHGLQLTMCDINTEALKYATVNAAENEINAEIIYSDGFSKITGTFDIIVTNPPIHAGKETIFKIYSDARKFLCEGGAFYTVVQKKHGAESHAAFLREVFESAETVYKRKGYYIYRCEGVMVK